MAEVTPLSPEEEASLRGSVAWLQSKGKSWAGRHDILRLLATLDAERVGGTTTDCPLVGVHEHAFRGPHRFHEWDPDRAWRADYAASLDAARASFMAADRALAVAHREDDQPCGCDNCMSYGAEDEGFDWYKIAPARRIVLRALDSGDDRLAPLAVAFREHEEAVALEATGEGPKYGRILNVPEGGDPRIEAHNEAIFQAMEREATGEGQPNREKTLEALKRGVDGYAGQRDNDYREGWDDGLDAAIAALRIPHPDDADAKRRPIQTIGGKRVPPFIESATGEGSGSKMAPGQCGHAWETDSFICPDCGADWSNTLITTKERGS